ncbi:MAG: c-type cytochrome biogenesis protein CcsB [Actinobacteria bacterium]|nr:c-type cytochrome biogenesis protein CcsB [Actinomycetota bacterium]
MILTQASPGSAAQVAEFSNTMTYATMLVLVVAMIAFAASFAARRTQSIDLRQREPALVGGDTVTAAPLPTGTADAGPDPDPDEPGRRAGNIALSLSWLAFTMLFVAVVARGVWAGRVPWGNMYEFSLTSALAILGVYLGVSTRRDVRWLGIFVIPLVLLTLGLAITVLYTETQQLVPALDSYWLVIHVSMAIVCGGAFLIAGTTAALYLIANRAQRPAGGPLSKLVCAVGRRLPEPERLDRLSYRIVAFAFPVWTFAIVAGAIWAESAWGRYWGWDPKETWAFITWVIFAGYLHAQSTAGWKGRKASWLAIIGLVAYIFNYFGVNLLFTGLHSYGGV